MIDFFVTREVILRKGWWKKVTKKTIMDNESKTVEEGFADLMHRVEIAEEPKKQR